LGEKVHAEGVPQRKTGPRPKKRRGIEGKHRKTKTDRGKNWGGWVKIGEGGDVNKYLQNRKDVALAVRCSGRKNFDPAPMCNGGGPGKRNNAPKEGEKGKLGARI